MELGKILKYQKGKAPGLTKGGNEFVVYLSPEYLRNKAQPTLIPDFWGKVEVLEKDLLLLWDGSNAGEFFVGKRGVLSSTMVKFTFDEEAYDKSFLYYQLKFVESYLKARTNGSGIPHVDKEILFSINIEHFSTSEQRAIAAILSKIDAAIAETEQLIAKYSRIKTGLMHDLLTKGIDDDGNIRSEETHEFKDSPLGRIPKEWEVVSLEDIKELITSGSRGWAQYYAEEGSVFIRITNLKRKQIHIDLSELKFVKLPPSAEGTRAKLVQGDLLISITADLGIIGVVSDNLEDAYINQHIALVRLQQENINSKFIGYFFSSYIGQSLFFLLNEGGAKSGLSLKTVAQLPVLKLSLPEQNEIVDKIEKQYKSIVQLHQTLTKLHSLKAGLMQDLLSGRVRVPVVERSAGE